MPLPDPTAESEFSLSDTQLRTIVHALPALICTGRADGSGIDFVNPRFTYYTSLSLARAPRWGWMDAVHPIDRSRLTACVESILASNTSQTTEVRLRRCDDTFPRRRPP